MTGKYQSNRALISMQILNIFLCVSVRPSSGYYVTIAFTFCYFFGGQISITGPTFGGSCTSYQFSFFFIYDSEGPLLVSAYLLVLIYFHLRYYSSYLSRCRRIAGRTCFMQAMRRIANIEAKLRPNMVQQSWETWWNSLKSWSDILCNSNNQLIKYAHHYYNYSQPNYSITLGIHSKTQYYARELSLYLVDWTQNYNICSSNGE